MSFNVALSGVSAAQKDLDTTANNIANVNTVGFKESRAEFASVYAQSLLAGGKTKVGDGAITTEVAQQFSQGSLQFTNNSLDMAITGNGFFGTVKSPESRDFSFTRAGQFKLNNDNYVVNSAGDNLLGFPVNPDGTSSSVALSTTIPVSIPDSSGAPKETTQVALKMNLPAGVEPVNPDMFNPDDPLTYNAATSVTVFDKLGDSHVMTYYFMKDQAVAPSNEWIGVTYFDGQALKTEGDTPGTPPITGDNVVGETSMGGQGISGYRLTFSNGGDFTGTQNADGTSIPTGDLQSVELGPNLLTNGADPSQSITTNFVLDPANATPGEPTQFASAFEVTSLEQDGLPVGRLTGIDIGPDGLVRATYSNGTSEPIVRVALVRFSNDQGLRQQSGTQWQESILSGEALAGEATTGTFGVINSSALEQANVNLTTELIDMIVAQRNFQANSRALEINNQLNQTILNIR
ncbi:MAG: flagellar hook protein FlgE [Paraglaciecola sp.]|jgi:flagellar hook protein FlgE